MENNTCSDKIPKLKTGCDSFRSKLGTYRLDTKNEKVLDSDNNILGSYEVVDGKIIVTQNNNDEE